MIRSNNPAMNPEYFSQARGFGVNESMTVQGTVNKAFFLFFLLVVSASWVWGKIYQPNLFSSGYQLVPSATAAVAPYMMGGLIVGTILGLVTVFKRDWARFTAPAYALCEGLVLGGVSATFELSYPGIVMQAVAYTFGVMFCMLALYKSRIIPVTNNLIMGIGAATGAIALVYFVSFIMSFFHAPVGFLYQGTPLGIGFSLVVVGIAAFNLIIDFYVIEEGERLGAEKGMEWYGAFALMVTLIWLYMEILRLLAKMRDRR